MTTRQHPSPRPVPFSIGNSLAVAIKSDDAPMPNGPRVSAIGFDLNVMAGSFSAAEFSINQLGQGSGSRAGHVDQLMVLASHLMNLAADLRALDQFLGATEELAAVNDPDVVRLQLLSLLGFDVHPSNADVANRWLCRTAELVMGMPLGTINGVPDVQALLVALKLQAQAKPQPEPKREIFVVTVPHGAHVGTVLDDVKDQLTKEGADDDVIEALSKAVRGWDDVLKRRIGRPEPMHPTPDSFRAGAGFAVPLSRFPRQDPQRIR